MTSNRMAGLPKKTLFSLYLTAGYPRLHDTRVVLRAAQDAGADMVEISIPFSDPVVDGPTIQAVNKAALDNGMTVRLLFEQLEGMRAEIHVPVFLMGYMNPMIRYGVENFLTRARDIGVDALIIPDMPFEEYERQYASLYFSYGVKPVFLITKRTDEKRIRRFDQAAPAFLYVVSSEATTGGRLEADDRRQLFFRRLKEMDLCSKLIVGFGVADKESFDSATDHTDGAIVASAFLRALERTPQGAGPHRSDPEALRASVIRFSSGIR